MTEPSKPRFVPPPRPHAVHASPEDALHASIVDPDGSVRVVSSDPIPGWRNAGSYDANSTPIRDAVDAFPESEIAKPVPTDLSYREEQARLVGRIWLALGMLVALAMGGWLAVIAGAVR